MSSQPNTIKKSSPFALLLWAVMYLGVGSVVAYTCFIAHDGAVLYIPLALPIFLIAFFAAKALYKADIISESKLCTFMFFSSIAFIIIAAVLGINGRTRNGIYTLYHIAHTEEIPINKYYSDVLFVDILICFASTIPLMLGTYKGYMSAYKKAIRVKLNNELEQELNLEHKLGEKHQPSQDDDPKIGDN